ncbi:MAG TPA: protein kinase [Ktedonobacterales bacterium]
MAAGTFSASDLTRIASRYQLGAELAKGALCTVYRGQDLALRRPVAIKVIPGEHIATYRRALEASAAFSHPAAICDVDAIEDSGHLFLIQELIAKARPLKDYVMRGAPVERALDLVAQVAAAIAYAHSFGVVHGDLTPAAVLVDSLAQAHINSFGMPADEDFLTDVTNQMRADPALAGVTLAERATGEASDVRMLGLLLWSLLAGPASEGGGSPGRGLRAETSEPVRALVRAAAGATRSASELMLDLHTTAEALAQLRPPQPEDVPPMVRAARAEVSRSPLWAQQPTSASRAEAMSRVPGTKPLAASVAASGPQPTQVLAPGEPVSRLSRSSSPYAMSDEAEHADETTVLLHPVEPTHSEAGSGISSTVIVLLCIILFVLFFLVGFYSTVLSR